MALAVGTGSGQGFSGGGSLQGAPPPMYGQGYGTPQNNYALPSPGQGYGQSSYAGAIFQPGGYNQPGPGGNYYQNQATPLGAIPGNPATDPAALQKWLLNQYSGQAGGLFGDLQAQGDAWDKQLSDITGGYGQRGSTAAQGADIQNRMLDLSVEGLGNQKDALARQTPLLDKLFGLRQQQSATERGHLTNLLGINEQQFQAQKGLAEVQRDVSTRSTLSDATARGAITASGTSAQLSDIGKQFGVTVANYQAARDYQNEGIQRRWDDSFFQDKIDQAQTAEQKAQIQDQQKNLDIMGRQYGLQREQIANSLAQTLASLGLDKILSVGQVLSGQLGVGEKAAQLKYELMSKALSDANTYQAAGVTPAGYNG